MKALKVFIVEDDAWYADFLAYQFELNPDASCKKFYSGKDLLDALHEQPDVITLDYHLPDIQGDALIERIRKEAPNCVILFISGQGDIATALNLIREGIFDYLVKDEQIKDRIWNTMLRIQEHRGLVKKVADLSRELYQKYDFKKSIIGNDPSMQEVFKLLAKACENQINVSISGETGTGKELIAKAIHYNSKFKKGPFVAVNVSAIPRELIESELFGHEKGAFTGALNRRVGKFEEASGGTLFLDEVGEMDPLTQVKLLRVLQEKELSRVGGNSTIKLQCRVLIATNRDLKAEVAHGRFREDLYYRLQGLPIHLPPLRKRKADIALLAKYFMQEFAKENEMDVKQLSEASVKKLMNYSFPGNIRELKSIIDLAMVLADKEVIEPEQLILNDVAQSLSIEDDSLTLKEANKRLISMYLTKHNNNVQKVAELLDIGKSTIYRLIKENEIELNG